MRTAIVVLAFLAIFGCGEDEGFNDICEPGRSVACVGPGGCSGSQTCIDGMEWSACDCGGGDSDALGDSEDVPPGESSDAGEDADISTEDSGAEEGASCGIGTCPPCQTCSEGICVPDPDCCDDGNECTIDEPSGDPSACRHRFYPDGTQPCVEVLGGRCYGAECCEGCWTGTTCIPQAESMGDPATCGSGGERCEACDDGNPCTENGCLDGGCYFATYVPNTTPCPGGVCIDGTCDTTVCGSDRGECCPDGSCGIGLTCVSRLGECRSCGAEALPCCTTGPRCDSGLTCNMMYGYCME